MPWQEELGRKRSLQSIHLDSQEVIAHYELWKSNRRHCRQDYMAEMSPNTTSDQSEREAHAEKQGCMGKYTNERRETEIKKKKPHIGHDKLCVCVCVCSHLLSGADDSLTGIGMGWDNVAR